MKKLMNFLMLSCRKATELIEKKSLTELRWKESVQLKMHTSMCKACSTYEKQSKWLDKILHRQFTEQHAEHSDQIIENKDLKERITSKL